jgi:hypothetical protein
VVTTTLIESLKKDMGKNRRNSSGNIDIYGEYWLSDDPHTSRGVKRGKKYKEEE